MVALFGASLLELWVLWATRPLAASWPADQARSTSTEPCRAPHLGIGTWGDASESLCLEIHTSSWPLGELLRNQGCKSAENQPGFWNVPGRQFSSPAWFWNELCQNWTLSTKCFDVDESVNSNKNLFSQNFSDQCYFLLLPSIFTNSQTFCVAPGEGLLPGPSWLPTPVPSLQAQQKRSARLLGSSLPHSHGAAAPYSSTATSTQLLGNSLAPSTPG